MSRGRGAKLRVSSQTADLPKQQDPGGDSRATETGVRLFCFLMRERGAALGLVIVTSVIFSIADYAALVVALSCAQASRWVLLSGGTTPE